MPRFFLPLLVLSLTMACDTPQDDACPPSSSGLAVAAPTDAPDLEFRETPFASYISSWNDQPISIKAFNEAIAVCADVQSPTWYLTLSAYLPAQTTGDVRVGGLGGSAWVTTDWLTCMKKHWAVNNAIEF